MGGGGVLKYLASLVDNRICDVGVAKVKVIAVIRENK